MDNQIHHKFSFYVFIISFIIFLSKVKGFEKDYETSAATLQEFKELVKDLLYRDFMKTDEYLLRWLRVSNFDVFEAYEKFHKSVQWRKENNIDNVILEDFSSYVDKYPYTYQGFDKEGHAVSWISWGIYDMRKITLAGKEKEFERYFIFSSELCEHYLYELQQNRTNNNNISSSGDTEVDDHVPGTFVVIDLKGLSLTKAACLKCLNLMAVVGSNYELYYPGGFYKIVLINAPNIVDIIVKASTSVMSDVSKRRISVYDYDQEKWKKALLEQIPDTNIPIEYGGKLPSLFNKPFNIRNTAYANIIAIAQLQQQQKRRMEEEKGVQKDIKSYSLTTTSAFNNATTNITSNFDSPGECSNSAANTLPKESINMHNKKMDNNDNPNSLHHHHHHFKKVASKQIEEEISDAREGIRWPTTVISRASTFATSQSIFGIILVFYIL